LVELGRSKLDKTLEPLGTVGWTLV
jgi:hypothetical protein